MSEFIEIVGGNRLTGTIQVSSAKNAALPVLIASLLTSETVEVRKVPNLEDVNLLCSLLEHLGSDIRNNDSTVYLKTEKLEASEASYSLVKALRASFWVLAPLLARGGAARVALPGGDIIGARPVDLHLAALEQMGADLKVKHGTVYATAPKGLRPAAISLRFPSVGATHQILMAAALTRGTTVIEGAACEPEVVALSDMLSAMGAEIEGAGTPKIVVSGKGELGGACVDLIGDRIEAGTYLLAAAITGGEVEVQGVKPEYFGKFLDVLDGMGLKLELGASSIRASALGRLRGVNVSTAPFPGVATDLQAPLMAALAVGGGTSFIEESVFEGRFGHVSELCRMGAKISVNDRIAAIEGVERLTGAEVEGMDIRAAASLVVAALAAEGVTTLHEPQHLRRGYERLEAKLASLGARISRRVADPEDYLFAGC